MAYAQRRQVMTAGTDGPCNQADTRECACNPASVASFPRDVAHATSHTDPVTCKPAAFHSATAAATSVAVRAQVCTTAPWLARLSTIARLLCERVSEYVSDVYIYKATSVGDRSALFFCFVGWGLAHAALLHSPEPLGAAGHEGALAVEAERGGHVGQLAAREGGVLGCARNFEGNA
jgi:hypothetical protein